MMTIMIVVSLTTVTRPLLLNTVTRHAPHTSTSLLLRSSSEMEPLEQGLTGGDAHSDIILSCACSSDRLPTDERLSGWHVLHSLSVTACSSSGDMPRPPFTLALYLHTGQATSTSRQHTTRFLASTATSNASGFMAHIHKQDISSFYISLFLSFPTTPSPPLSQIS